jgi:hypothetical protein|tara:strand:+ start:1682 stop:1852 length:171 start_codon:yes stop_codon:yes gene_type:complete
MNGRTTKKLKKLFNPEEGDEISKKSYRVAKKHYNRLNKQEKKDFLANLNKVNNSKI